MSKDFFFETSHHQWNPPGNPSIYAPTLMPLDPLLEELNQREGFSERDLLLFVTYGLVQISKKYPRINSYQFMNRRVERKGIRFSYMVKSKNPETSLFLHPMNFEENTSISSMKVRLYEELRQARTFPLDFIRFSSQVMLKTPSVLRSFFFKIFYFLSLQKLFPFVHRLCPHDLFGSIIISYVGSLGLPGAFIPLLKHSSNTLILAVGLVEKKLELDSEKNIVEKKYLQLSWTIDHRFTHGPEVANFYRDLKKYFLNPKKFFENS